MTDESLSRIAFRPKGQYDICANTIDQLNKFLDEIPENFRMAVVLRDFQELSYEEISTILEIPIGTIKSRINRGRIQLAQKMKHFKE